jgi:hypothetical protein
MLHYPSFDVWVARSSSATGASMSSISMALAEWSNTVSAARTRVECGAVGPGILDWGRSSPGLPDRPVHMQHSQPAHQERLNAVVTFRNDLSPGLMTVRVAPVGWALSEFEPGQGSVANFGAGILIG